MIKINASPPVEGICEVSNRVATQLFSQYFRETGRYHIFQDGLHAVLEIAGERDIRARKEGDRDGRKFRGSLKGAIEMALANQDTVGIAYKANEPSGSEDASQQTIGDYLHRTGKFAQTQYTRNGKTFHVIEL